MHATYAEKKRFSKKIPDLCQKKTKLHSTYAQKHYATDAFPRNRPTPSSAASLPNASLGALPLSPDAQKAAIDKLWVPGPGFFRAWWQERPKAPGQQDALHSDALYGSVWAHLLGLGPLVEASRVRRHLRAEAERLDSPYGLMVMHNDTEPSGVWRDNIVWNMGSMDWSALALYSGAAPPEEALRMAEKVWEGRPGAGDFFGGGGREPKG